MSAVLTAHPLASGTGGEERLERRDAVRAACVALVVHGAALLALVQGWQMQPPPAQPVLAAPVMLIARAAAPPAPQNDAIAERPQAASSPAIPQPSERPVPQVESPPPVPEPKPTPEPLPKPQAMPAPEPEPNPDPKPQPRPEPKVRPETQQKPKPVPQPSSRPSAADANPHPTPMPRPVSPSASAPSGPAPSRPPASTGQPAPAAGMPDVRSYQPVQKEPPSYPRRALDRGLEGDCTVRYDVRPDGRVSNPAVVGQCHPLFVQPSLASARSFRYRPHRIDGRAVTVPGVQNTFHYRIQAR